ncbi:MAG: LON peptidase substrate-binding domain-containing protein [Chromatiales bacterium]|nr:MAG: LON peptidase substrate-binding domain-containing protein [Chromatiales bacterium]
MTDSIPLFPLRTVLFPGGPLPLRVFEPRYLDMISRCMKDDAEFGVVMIRDGSEVGDARIAEIGTRARITDWYQGSDGILGVTAVGTQRFVLQAVDKQADGLYLGTVEALAPEPEVALPAEYEPMATLLKAVIEDLGKLYDPLPKHYEDAAWVAARFAEILPMEIEQKQTCLEIDDPIQRLEYVRPLLRAIRQESQQ